MRIVSVNCIKTYLAYGIMSADLSLMDLLFDKEDPLITFDKDIKSDDLKYKTISVSSQSVRNKDCTIY